MKKIIGTLCLFLFGTMSAMAHPGHQSTYHIHLTDAVTIGITTVLAIVITIASLLLVKEQMKKKRNNA